MGDVGIWASLALDCPDFDESVRRCISQPGNPVVSYTTRGTPDLKVLHCSNANCSGNQTPNTLDNVVTNTTLALDASGFPVVSYYDLNNEDQKVLHCTNANCTAGNIITAPETAGSVGGGGTSHLRLDAFGFPVVSYYDATNGDLKLLHCGDANCGSGTVGNTTCCGVKTVNFPGGVTVKFANVTQAGTTSVSPTICTAAPRDFNNSGQTCYEISTSAVFAPVTATTANKPSGYNNVPGYINPWSVEVCVPYAGSAAVKFLHYENPVNPPQAFSGNTPDRTSRRTTGTGQVVCGKTLSLSPMMPAELLPPEIAFQSDRDGNQEVYSMLADGSDPINLTNNPATDGQPDWSPDGTKIAFYTDRDSDYEIYTMNADGSSPARVTNSPGADVSPAWSPDGTKIAFQSMRDGNWEIYSMLANGSGQTNLTNNGALDANAVWSPDGTKIAFWSDEEGDPQIYTMNADGTGRTQLTTIAANELPAWSPDGTKIAFDTNRDGNYEIYTMNANGSNQTNVTSSPPADEQAPSWKTDGAQIVYHSNGYVTNDIWVMNANGTGQVPLETDLAADVYPAWSRVTLPGEDYDEDGCPDAKEAGPNQLLGGLRNPLNGNDYFNPSHDGQNRIDDILLTVNAYFKDRWLDPPTNTIPNPAYNPDTDRVLPTGAPHQWSLQAGDGLQRVDDILNSVHQYFHDCS